MTSSKPKILALDIENSYILAGVWGLWENGINIDRIFDVGKVMCYAARFQGSPDVYFRRHTDPDFLACIHHLLSEADAVLTFNGRRHDLPLLNREFLKNGMTPPSPYKHIDLLETAKKAFKFPSNKLQHLVSELGIGSKMDHEGFQMWVDCLQGDENAWRQMERYNKHDVKLLEKLYKRLLPWISSHPNYNLFSTHGMVCTNCGSSHLQRRGTHKTQTAIYERFQCQKCGKWNRSRFTSVDKEARTLILTGAE